VQKGLSESEKLRRDTARRTVEHTKIDSHGSDEAFHPWKLGLAIPALLVFAVVTVPVALVLTFASCFVVLVRWLAWRGLGGRGKRV
jgi:hypothetical protein